jgi:hypothetical protein
VRCGEFKCEGSHLEIKIGDEISVDGIVGTVKGVERHDDGTPCGVILKSVQVQHPLNLVHLKLDERNVVLPVEFMKVAPPDHLPRRRRATERMFLQ